MDRQHYIRQAGDVGCVRIRRQSSRLLTHSGNTLQQYNYDFATPVYENSDVNMDAKTKYRGTSNDASFVFFNVVTKYVGKNVGSLYNYDLFLEQLP